MSLEANGCGGCDVEIGVLGPMSATRSGAVVALGGPKQRTVLAVMSSRPNTCVSLDALIDGVWGDDLPAAVETSVQSYVSNIRTRLGVEIERIGRAYRLRIAEGNVDAVRFERLVSEGMQLAAERPDAAGPLLRNALALWRGKPYTDLDDVPLLEGEARRLRMIRIAAVEALVDAELALGGHRSVLGLLSALIEENPWHDGLAGRYMVALYRDGQVAEALRAYQRLRRTLADELGIDPAPEVQRLELGILHQRPQVARILAELDECPSRPAESSQLACRSAPVRAERFRPTGRS